ncbi:MAG: MCE family protein [Bacteroidaceae bacterium]|nr:MCE family protein [Bacteroidaceae bacterium]
MKISNEFKIGLAGIVALAILYFGINFLKGMSSLRSQNIYYVAFDNIKQVAVSSPVYADGYKVGVVHDIHFDYKHNGKVIVEIDVDQDLRIPKGSTAALESAMLGGSTMHLLLANNPKERYEVGDTISGGEMPGLLTKAGDMLPQVEQILKHVDTLVVTLNTLAADSNLHTIMANVQHLTANLNQSSVALNHLLTDDTPRMLETFTTTGEHVTALTDKFQALELEKSIASLNETLASLNASVAKLNSKDNSMGLLLNDTTLYGNLNQTVNSANALLVDLKANPKRYVHFSVFGKK